MRRRTWLGYVELALIAVEAVAVVVWVIVGVICVAAR